MWRLRFNVHHTDILCKIYLLKGFTGNQELGTHHEMTNIPEDPQLPPPVASDVREPLVHIDMLDNEEELEDEQAGEDEDILVLGAYYILYLICRLMAC